MSKVSIVENPPIHARELELFCNRGNHDVVGKYQNVDDFIRDFERNSPEVVLIDAHLRSQLYEKNTPKITENGQVIIIYMFAHFDPALLSGAWYNYQFVAIKPIQEIKLQEMIRTALATKLSASVPAVNYSLTDRIFVRDKYRYVAVKLSEIYSIKADRCYTEIHTKTKRYIASESLNHFEELIPAKNFIRIHRSWIINMHYVDAIEECRLEIQGQMIPMGKTYRKRIKSMLNII